MQYYNLIHLGFSGYREVMENCLANARILSQSLEATGWYTCLSDIHRPAPQSNNNNNTNHAAEAAADMAQRVKGAVASATGNNNSSTDPPSKSETSAAYVAGLPVVSFRLTDAFRAAYPHVKQETISLLLRARQWIVPNYALPPGEDATEILRVVVRVSMSFDLLDRLVTDIVQVTETLMDKDEVDLSILQEQHRKGPVKKGKDKKGEGKGEGEGGAEGGARRLGRELKKRMADGIHRSVC